MSVDAVLMTSKVRVTKKPAIENGSKGLILATKGVGNAGWEPLWNTASMKHDQGAGMKHGQVGELGILLHRWYHQTMQWWLDGPMC